MKPHPLEPSELTGPLRAAVDRIFTPSSGETGEVPFRCAGWTLALLPDSFPKEAGAFFHPLAQVAGTDKVVLTEDLPAHERTYVIDWDAKQYLSARFRIAVGSLMFDDTERWGVVTAMDNYLWVGGDDILLPLWSELGGLEQLNAEFEEFLEAMSEDIYGEQLARLQKAMAASREASVGG